jgi:hypothetical protein
VKRAGSSFHGRRQLRVSSIVGTKIGGERDVARGKGSDKVVFTCTNRPFGRVSAMIPRGDIFHSNIFGNEKFV